MKTAQSHDIEVTARLEFLARDSNPAEGRFVWAYTITIVNRSSKRVQLLSRVWEIIDETGRRTDVRGAGVVGLQPLIEPGGRFEYTSGCPLPTPSGMMIGSYQMIDADGMLFDVAIPAFSLDSPHALRRFN